MRQQESFPPISIFCVAAPSDTELLTQWEMHLLPLAQAGKVSIRSQRNIQLGITPRIQQMHAYLDQSNLIVLLVSAAFFADEECIVLMKRAIQRTESSRARLIPLLLSPAAWQESPLAPFSCIPSDNRPVTKWSNRAAAFDTCVRDIRRLLDHHSTTIPSARTDVMQNRAGLLRPVRTIRDTQHYFVELHSIFSPLKISQKTLYKVYRICVPEDPLHIYGYENATTLSEMLDFLLAAPVGIGGMPAILKFSERCALLSEPHTSSLRAWGDAFIQDMEISSQLLTHFRKEIEAEAEFPRAVASALPLHLIIVLKTSQEDPQALRVKAWLCYGQDEPDPLSSPVEEQTYTIDAMSDLLDEMLAEVQTRSMISVQAKAELNIEFFLPHSLISLPVDHWKIAEGTVVLGARYRVVVRSLDRIESRRIYDHSVSFWKMKWKQVSTLSCNMGQEHIRWIKDTAAYDGEKVYYTFSGLDQKAICLCLALAPLSSVDRDNKQGVFRMALRAGIPILFWPKSLPRNPDQTEHFCEELDQLLGRYKPTELPDALFKQRWEAALHKEGEHHLGRCLTLLWDDPNRIPPTGKLVQIEQRR
jgi:hypothetical protein